MGVCNPLCMKKNYLICVMMSYLEYLPLSYNATQRVLAIRRVFVVFVRKLHCAGVGSGGTEICSVAKIVYTQVTDAGLC